MHLQVDITARMERILVNPNIKTILASQIAGIILLLFLLSLCAENIMLKLHFLMHRTCSANASFNLFYAFAFANKAVCHLFFAFDIAWTFPTYTLFYCLFCIHFSFLLLKFSSYDNHISNL